MSNRMLGVLCAAMALTLALTAGRTEAQKGSTSNPGRPSSPVVQPKNNSPVQQPVQQPFVNPQKNSFPANGVPLTGPRIDASQGTPQKMVSPLIVQPKVTPLPLTGPKVEAAKVVPPKITPPALTAPKDITNAAKVLPKIDTAKNPPVKFDPKLVDSNKLSLANKNVVDLRKKGEESLISQNKLVRADLLKARDDAHNRITKDLTPLQKKQADDLGRIRLKTEGQLLAAKKTAPANISTDTAKLLAFSPKMGTTATAKVLASNAIPGQKLVDLKNSTADPYARKVYDNLAPGKKVSPVEFAFLQTQLNNPTLTNANRATIASALQVQSDFRRQDRFVDALSRLNGGGGYSPYYPSGAPIAQGQFGGLFGTYVGNYVYPGHGVIIYPGYTTLPANIVFHRTGLIGYIDYGPAIYYPPIQGLDGSGGVVVQTLPCGCNSNVAYLNPAQTAEPGAVGQPAPDPAADSSLIIDPTSQDVWLTTRYLRLINSSKEKATVSIVLRTPSGDDGSFVWLPDDPGKSDGAFTIEIMPGEEKDIYSGETPLHGSRARIWATGESGRVWRQFENADFWLVPETDDNGVHAYSAPGMETSIYNLQ